MKARARRAASARGGRSGLLRHTRDAFLNVPYDKRYERLFLAFVAGLCGFGLIPRATVEIPGSRRRLERINELIRECRYSFHDLSRVALDRTPPPTPRFNMPFELGLAVAWSVSRRGVQKLFLFESKPHRLSKSLSDLNGTDPYIHNGEPEGVLRELTNALVRERDSPSLDELKAIYNEVRRAASRLKRTLGGASLFEARPFRDLVVLAIDICTARR
jgi:hypothetical protein